MEKNKQSHHANKLLLYEVVEGTGSVVIAVDDEDRVIIDAYYREGLPIGFVFTPLDEDLRAGLERIEVLNEDSSLQPRLNLFTKFRQGKGEKE